MFFYGGEHSYLLTCKNEHIYACAVHNVFANVPAPIFRMYQSFDRQQMIYECVVMYLIEYLIYCICMCGLITLL
jgi:hypothetical protein